MFALRGNMLRNAHILRSRVAWRAARPRPQSTSTALENVGAAAEKKKTFGGRVTDYFVDHPSHFFGPIAGLVLLLVLRANRSNDNQDLLVRSLDESSPLHAREVSGLGSKNDLNISQWRAAVDMVLTACLEQRSKAAGSGSGSGSGSGCTLRPSEVEYAFATAAGKRLADMHMLQRTTLLEELQRLGYLQSPATDAEAAGWLERREAEESSAEAAQHGKKYVPRGGAISGPFTALMDLLTPHEVVQNERVMVQPPVEAIAAAADAPGDALHLLSLYSTLLGGREEPPRPPAPKDDAEKAAAAAAAEAEARTPLIGASVPTPSQRLSLSVRLLRQYRAMEAAQGTDKAGPPTNTQSGPLVPSTAGPIRKTYRLIKSSVVGLPPPAALPEAEAPPSGDKLDTDTLLQPVTSYSQEELVDLIGLLAETHQVPTRCRTGVSEKWPVKRWHMRPPVDALAEGMEEAGLWEAAQSGRRLTPKEAQKAMLNSRGVCAWGECYSNPIY